jgi:hypothetical protein
MPTKISTIGVGLLMTRAIRISGGFLALRTSGHCFTSRVSGPR